VLLAECLLHLLDSSLHVDPHLLVRAQLYAAHSYGLAGMPILALGSISEVNTIAAADMGPRQPVTAMSGGQRLSIYARAVMVENALCSVLASRAQHFPGVAGIGDSSAALGSASHAGLTSQLETGTVGC